MTDQKLGPRSGGGLESDEVDVGNIGINVPGAVALNALGVEVVGSVTTLPPVVQQAFGENRLNENESLSRGRQSNLGLALTLLEIGFDPASIADQVNPDEGLLLILPELLGAGAQIDPGKLLESFREEGALAGYVTRHPTAPDAEKAVPSLSELIEIVKAMGVDETAIKAVIDGIDYDNGIPYLKQFKEHGIMLDAKRLVSEEIGSARKYAEGKGKEFKGLSVCNLGDTVVGYANSLVEAGVEPEFVLDNLDLSRGPCDHGDVALQRFLEYLGDGLEGIKAKLEPGQAAALDEFVKTYIDSKKVKKEKQRAAAEEILAMSDDERLRVFLDIVGDDDWIIQDPGWRFSDGKRNPTGFYDMNMFMYEMGIDQKEAFDTLLCERGDELDAETLLGFAYNLRYQVYNSRDNLIRRYGEDAVFSATTLDITYVTETVRQRFPDIDVETLARFITKEDIQDAAKANKKLSDDVIAARIRIQPDVDTEVIAGLRGVASSDDAYLDIIEGVFNGLRGMSNDERKGKYYSIRHLCAGRIQSGIPIGEEEIRSMGMALNAVSLYDCYGSKDTIWFGAEELIEANMTELLRAGADIDLGRYRRSNEKYFCRIRKSLNYGNVVNGDLVSELLKHDVPQEEILALIPPKKVVGSIRSLLDAGIDPNLIRARITEPSDQ